MQINNIYKLYDINLRVLDNMLDKMIHIFNKFNFASINDNTNKLQEGYINIIKEYVNKFSNIQEDIVIIMDGDTASGLFVNKFEMDIINNSIIINFGKKHHIINIEEINISDKNILINILIEMAELMVESMEKYEKKIDF